MAVFVVSLTSSTTHGKEASPETAASETVSSKSVRVGSLTADRIYLDAGSADGLKRGAEVKLFQKRKSLGVCTVVDVSNHHAACVGDVVQGVTKATYIPIPVRERAAPPSSMVSPSSDDVGHAATALTAAVFPKVEHVGKAKSSTLRLPIEVWASERAHLSNDRVPGYHVGKLGVALRSVPLYFDGLSVRARADLGGAFVLPERARFRGDEPLRTDLYELALAYRPTDGIFFVEAGRLLVSGAPSAPRVDGASMGLRFFDDRMTLGAYGGLIPDPVNFAPRLDAYAGGAFVNGDVVIGPVIVRPTARLGVTADIGLDARLDAEASVSAAWGQFVDATVFARASDTSAAPLLPFLDLAFAEVGTSPFANFRAGARYRYNAPSLFDLGMPDAALPTEFGRHHADVYVRYEPFDYAGAALDVGGFFDPVRATTRAFIGPELNIPRAFSGMLRARVSLQEEVGTNAARMVLSSLSVSPDPRSRVEARAYGIEERAFGDPRRDVGVALRADVAAFTWFRVFGDARVQGGLPSTSDYPRSTPVGMFAEVGVSGAL